MSFAKINLLLNLQLIICVVLTLFIISTQQHMTEDDYLKSILFGHYDDPNEVPDPGEPFVRIGRKYYIVHQGRKVNWFEAFYLCTSYGAELANIENDEEMKAISDYLLSLPITDSDWFWLSGNTLMGPDGVFISANTQKRMSYTNWLPGQPDKAGGIEYCVHLWPQTNTKTIGMNDWICGNQAHFLCVHPKINMTHEPSNVVPIRPAPPMSGHVQIGAKHYIVMDNSAVNWFEAESSCNSQNMHLAQIQNDFEMTAISNYLLSRNYNGKQFWIAGNDRYREGAFMWTGIYTRQNMEVTYTKWSVNNPDNYQNDQDCIVLWKMPQGWLMDDDKCEKRYNYICQVPEQYPRYQLLRNIK